MRLKIAIILFFIGTISIILSFSLRESYEKQMYQIYLSDQKSNLVRGWNKSWKEYLITYFEKKGGAQGYRVAIDRGGKLLTKNFFPKKSSVPANWGAFAELDKNKKLEFLKKQFAKAGSWDRSIALKKWMALGEKLPDIELSDYEKTIASKEARYAFNLIFEQLKKRRDYSSVGRAYELDLAFFYETQTGEIELFIPSISFLQKELLSKFELLNRISGLFLEQSPFELNFERDIIPTGLKPVREKVIGFLGFLILIFSIILYFVDLRRKRIEVLKKVSFLNQLVHEVKTPITGIRLNSELLLKHGYDQELVDALLKSSTRLNDFFEDIVLINRNDNLVRYEKLDSQQWASYLQEIVSEYPGKVELDNRVSSAIRLDRSRVRIIVRNLIKNAIRYGSKASCECFCKHGNLFVRVVDEGPGISIEDSSKIFQEFYRGDTAKEVSPNGLGIGLSIVTKLAKDMESEVRLENAGEKGARFLLKVGGQNEL